MNEKQIEQFETEANKIYGNMEKLDIERKNAFKKNDYVEMTRTQKAWEKYDAKLDGIKTALEILGYNLDWNPLEGRYEVFIDWKKISD